MGEGGQLTMNRALPASSVYSSPAGGLLGHGRRETGTLVESGMGLKTSVIFRHALP